METFYYSSNDQNYEKLIETIMIEAIVIFAFLLSLMITFFLKFHLKLMSDNKTTIENLEFGAL